MEKENEVNIERREIFLTEEKKTGGENEENFWRKKIFWGGEE